jgi:hypothetical protein
MSASAAVWASEQQEWQAAGAGAQLTKLFDAHRFEDLHNDLNVTLGLCAARATH